MKKGEDPLKNSACQAARHHAARLAQVASLEQVVRRARVWDGLITKTKIENEMWESFKKPRLTPDIDTSEGKRDQRTAQVLRRGWTWAGW